MEDSAHQADTSVPTGQNGDEGALSNEQHTRQRLGRKRKAAKAEIDAALGTLAAVQVWAPPFSTSRSYFLLVQSCQRDMKSLHQKTRKTSSR